MTMNIEDTSSAINAMSVDLQDVYNRQQANAEEQARLATQTGDSRGRTPLEVAVAGMAELERQRVINRMKGAMNYEEVLMQAARDGSTALEQSRGLVQKIAEKKSVSLFDDPIQALLNDFTIPWDQQELNGQLGIAEHAAKTVDFLNTKLSSTAQTADLIRERVSEASVAETARAVQADIDLKVKLYDMKGLSSEADKIKAAMAATKEQNDLWLRGKQAAESEERLQLAREGRELQRKHYADMEKKAKNPEELEDLELGIVNQALVSLNRKPFDTADKSIFRIKKAQNDPMLKELFDYGLTLRTSREGDTPSYGIGPIGRAITRKTLGIDVAAGSNERAGLVELEEAARVATLANPEAAKDKKSADVAAQTEFKRLAQEKMNRVEKNGEVDKTNAFHGVAWQTLNEQAWIKSNPLWAKYVAPTITQSNANEPMSVGRITDIMRVAMKQDKVSFEEAAELIQMAAASSAHLNTLANKFETDFGIAQTHYGVTMRAPETPGVRAAADLITAAAAAGVATGVGIVPAGIVAGVAQGVKYNATRQTLHFDAIDLVAVRNVLMRYYAADVLGTAYISRPLGQ